MLKLKSRIQQNTTVDERRLEMEDLRLVTINNCSFLDCWKNQSDAFLWIGRVMCFIKLHKRALDVPLDHGS